MPEIPEELRRRIAVARARALGEGSGEIPAASVGDLDPRALPEGVASPAAGPTEMPAGLLERVRAARRQAIEGLGPVLERNAVPKQNVPRITPERIPVTRTAPTAPAPATPVSADPVEPPEAVQVAAPAATAGMSLEQAAEVLGMPEKLLRRSVDAKAKALGVSFDEALAGMLGGAAPEAPAATESATPAADAVAAVPESPVPVSGVAPVPVAEAPSAAAAGMSLEQAAEALGYPEKLFRRSVEAKAKAEGVSFDEALTGMLGGVAPATSAAPASPAAAAPVAAPATPVETPAPAAPVVETPVTSAAAPAAPAAAGMSLEEAAEALGYPEKLFRRSVEAKAKAEGVSFDEALTGMLGGVAPATSAAPASPAAAAPVAAPATPVETPAPAAPQPVVSPPVGAMSVEEAAVTLGMPEKLFRRSVEAKAKALGVSFDQALADMVGTKAPVVPASTAAAPAPQPAPAAVAPDVAVPEAEPLPVPAAAEALAVAPTEAAETPAKQGGPSVEAKQLYRVELVTAVISAIILALLALAGPAPVFRQAGGAADPSRIPWYLVWVAQLFAWMPRDTAGFFAPLLVIIGLFAVPFVDRNPESNPSHRRFAIALFGIFMAALLVLTVIGLINRPGGFGWPWS